MRRLPRRRRHGRRRDAGRLRHPLPDFTDCSFDSPEAAADWLAVAHDGGPVRAFDRRMPAFGEALTAAELERTVSLHARLLRRSGAGRAAS